MDFITPPRETIVDVPRLAPLACRKCGVIDQPIIGPGKGPHWKSARCRHCDAWLDWLSRYPPDERQVRRQAARDEGMARKPPTSPQLAYLSALGYTGTCPVTMAAASQLIDHLLQQKGQRV